MKREFKGKKKPLVEHNGIGSRRAAMGRPTCISLTGRAPRAAQKTSRCGRAHNVAHSGLSMCDSEQTRAVAGAQSLL